MLSDQSWTIYRERSQLYNAICFCLATLLNIVVVVIVKTKTTPQLNDFRKVILYQCFKDFVFAACQFFVQPIQYFDPVREIGVHVSNSPWVEQLQNYGFYLHLLHTGALSLMLQSSLVPVFVRYLIVFRQKRITTNLFIRIMIAMFFWVVWSILTNIILCYHNPDVDLVRNILTNWNAHLLVLNVFDKTTSSLILQIHGMFSLIALYVLFLFFTCKIWLKLRSVSVTVRGHIGIQITRVLCAQAFVTLFLDILPSVLLILNGLFKWDEKILYFSFLYALMPVLSPVLVVLYIRPYRNSICKLFRSRSTASTPIDTIQNLDESRRVSFVNPIFVR